jgi:hypothetical protein
MMLHRITEFYTEGFFGCLSITWNFRNVAIFKSFVKQYNDSNKNVLYARYYLLYQISLVLSG